MPAPPVQFDAPYILPSFLEDHPTQLVSQQATSAVVTLSRPSTAGVLQVQVTTDGFSGAAGVNAGVVDQTVTFADGQSQATLAIPIIPGAPNPGVVDVELGVEPVAPQAPYPPTQKGRTLDLKVVAADPAGPPRVDSVDDAGRGLLLIFNKPMDPAAAAKVANYAVTRSRIVEHGGLFGFFTHSKTVTSAVPIRAAQYDAATQSVLLVPRNPHFAIGMFTTVKQVHRAGTAAGAGRSSHAARGLVDLQRTPINASSDPGKVAILIKDDPLSSGGFGL